MNVQQVKRQMSYCCVKHGKVNQAQYLNLKGILISTNTANINIFVSDRLKYKERPDLYMTDCSRL